jgi:hypothetical protein
METPKGEISLSKLLCGDNAHSLPLPTRVTSELPTTQKYLLALPDVTVKIN